MLTVTGRLSGDILPYVLVELRGVHVVERFHVHRFYLLYGKFIVVFRWFRIFIVPIEKADPSW